MCIYISFLLYQSIFNIQEYIEMRIYIYILRHIIYTYIYKYLDIYIYTYL